MDIVSILLGVAFPTLFFTGLGLALASVSHTAYVIAKVAFCLAALDLAGLLVWWIYTAESAAWKTMLGAAFGLAVVASLPEILRWVDGNEEAVIAERARLIGKEAADFGPIVEALRQNQRALAESEHTRSLLGTVLLQFDHLQQGIQTEELFSGQKNIDNRLRTAEHIIKELKVILGNVQTLQLPQGQALIIKTAPNTFRVTFPVPMRIPPTITFNRYPDGATPTVTEKSNIGFTVIFTPPSVPVEMFWFEAEAEL
jgi:hypothetical protein